jgi:RNA polymerase sigma-70 factor (ECF subfamily)
MEDREHRAPEPDSDVELLARIAGGDRAAFEQLFHRYYPRLFAFVHRNARRFEPIDEVVSDTLLAVWRQAGEFRGRARASSWILGIAYRKTLKALARDRRRRTSEQALVGVAEPADGAAGPERAFAAREQHQALEQALAELSDEQRAVVELAFVEGCSYAEIAAILDCPLNTVKTRMHHARRRLRSRLDAPLATRRQHDGDARSGA